MFCSNCGNEIKDGQKFCTACGTPVPEQAVTPMPEQTITPSAPVTKSGNKSGLILMISLVAGSVVLLFIGSLITTNQIEKAKEEFVYPNSYNDIDFNPDDYWDEDDLNIDLDSLNMDDYNFDYDFDSEDDDFDDYDSDNYDFDEYAEDYEDTLEDYIDSDDDSSNSLTYDLYKYATLEYKEGGLELAPKGNVNDSTIVYDGKDIGGFLDYVDDKVLEKGRKINRKFFYDLYAVNIVDPDVYKDNPSQMVFGLISSLSFANEFYTMDVSVDSLSVSNDKPNVYNYSVTAIGKKDLWTLDFDAKTMYMNDGKTEYVSTMLKDDTLAVWATVVEEYFGLSL